MRRYAFLILFAVVLVTPFLLRLAIGTGSDGQADRRNAPRRIVIITPHAEGIRREFQEAFSAWLKARGEPDVAIDYRNFGGGAADIVKYFGASVGLYRSIGTFRVDLVWGGGDYLFDTQLRKQDKSMPEGYLEPVALRPEVMAAAYPTPDVGGVALYDPAAHWYGTALGSFGIVYNKDVVRHLGVAEPKTWADLADPRYRGWLVLADPTRSSSAKTTFMAVVEKAMADAWDADAPAKARHADLKARQAAAEQAGDKDATAKLKAAANDAYQQAMDPGWRAGMGLIRRIAANARVFTDNSLSVPATVGSGDAAAGMAIDFYGRTEVEFSGDARVGYVEPVGATIVNPDPIALVRGAEHRDAAVRFVEFVLSTEGQRLWNARPGAPDGPRATALRRLPIVRSVYADSAYVSRHFSDRVNPFEVAGSFNTRNDRKQTFPILGELIQASCLDLLDELRDTRTEILASPKAADLDRQLGTFPFGQTEAVERQKRYSGAKPIDRLALMRAWEDEFANEYRELRAQAK